MAGLVSPLNNSVSTYTGFGSGVLKPGTVVAPGGYTGPSSIIASGLGNAGVGISTGQPVNKSISTGQPVNKSYVAPSGPSAQQLAANSQIDQINRLLGVIDSQGQAGLGRLDSSYNDTKTRLGEQKAKTMDRYGQQYITNDKDKQRGIEQVDDFAKTSYNSLQRLLQGANAGNSSVGRTLMPYLVNKGASSRRQGVFDTAGENQREIDMAKGDAEDQFRYAFQDTDNQYNEQKQGFLSNIEQQKMDLLAKKLGLEQDAGLATAGTEAELNSRTAALQSLFGQYAPSFTARAMNLKTPELGKYTLDPGQIKLGQNQGSGSYYTNPIKKRQELEV